MFGRRYLLRVNAVIVVAFALFAAVGFRLFQVQCVQHEIYVDLIQTQHTVERTVPAKRGLIVDCHNRVLAIRV